MTPHLRPGLIRLRNELMGSDALKIIAERLNISTSTCKVYSVELFRAMRVNSRVELMAAEIRQLRCDGARQGAD